MLKKVCLFEDSVFNGDSLPPMDDVADVSVHPDETELVDLIVSD